VASDRGHAESTILAHALLPEELELLAALFPAPPPGERDLAELLAPLDADVGRRFDGEDARSRLAALAARARTTEPTLLAAVALANEPGLDTLRYLWIVREHGPARELPFDELLAAVALDDEPDGRLPVDAIAGAALVGDLHDRFGGATVSESPWRIVGRVRRALGGQSASVACGVDVGWDRAEVVSDAADVVAALRAAGFGEDALERAAVRVLLKGGRIPERIRRTPDGRVLLETLEEGAWQELDLAAEPGRRVFSGSFGTALGRRAKALVREAADG
jgi:hypothetical protein